MSTFPNETQENLPLLRRLSDRLWTKVVLVIIPALFTSIISYISARQKALEEATHGKALTQAVYTDTSQDLAGMRYLIQQQLLIQAKQEGRITELEKALRAKKTAPVTKHPESSIVKPPVAPIGKEEAKPPAPKIEPVSPVQAL